VKFDCQSQRAEKEPAEKGNRDHSSSRKERRVEKRRNCSRSIWKSPSKVQSCNSVLRSVSSFDAAVQCFFLLLVVLVLYIHEIVVSGSFKRIRISCADVSRITFPFASVSTSDLVYTYIYIYMSVYIQRKAPKGISS